MIPLSELAKTHLNLNLSQEVETSFEAFTTLLIEWSERFNLTTITEPQEIRIKHFLDSLSLLTLADLPESAKVIDVGSGAGLPGLALALLCPGWQVTLIEATGKKVTFINHAIEELKLPNARAIQLRAEDAGQDPKHREAYDFAVARAVARMPVLAEYLLPLCKVGGRCVAMKGETAANETADAAFALQTLGGELLDLVPIYLPGIEGPHYLVPVQKVRKTPTEYPRRAGLPSKKPLEA